MKKLMILAMMAVAANTAFAQDALKNILKSKDYTEASSLVQSNLSTMNDEQKAKAYNKLVDLSLEKVNKEIAVIQSNQLAEQFKQGKVEPVDSAGMYDALRKAMSDAMECEKYDILPNAKGKVAPKFHKSNRDRLWGLRANLINAGQDALVAGDNASALKNWSLYVETSSTVSPLFKDIDAAKAADPYLGEVARVAATLAYQSKDLVLADKYCDVALTDTASYKAALDLKTFLMQQNAKTHEDSLKCVNTFEQLYAKDKNENLFLSLANLYGSLKMTDKQSQFIAERIQNYPDNFAGWAVRGQIEMNDNKYNEAIADFKKAIEFNSKKGALYTYLGFCLNNVAAAVNDPTQQKALLSESVGYLETARDLDPDRRETNWAYPLYQCYYNLYGDTDARTKDVESLIK